MSFPATKKELLDIRMLEEVNSKNEVTDNNEVNTEATVSTKAKPANDDGGTCRPRAKPKSKAKEKTVRKSKVEKTKPENQIVAARSGADISEEQLRFQDNDSLVQSLRLAFGHIPTEKIRSGTDLYAVEAGVYRGRSLAVLGSVVEQLPVSIKLLGLDSFQGIGQIDVDDVKTPREKTPKDEFIYSDTSLREVEAYIAPFEFSSRVELLAGDFSDTLAALPKKRQYFYVNVSCKYSLSTKLVLDYFYPRLNSGGVLFFHDYFRKSDPTARIAIDDFLKDKPEPLYQIQCGEGHSSFKKAMLIKS